MIAVVDYGAGNIHSVVNCLKKLNADSIVTQKRSTLEKCDGIILPGVGAFGYARKKLDELSLGPVLQALGRGGKPLLGICLGMQLLLNSSEESPEAKGLGLIEGRVTKLCSDGKKIPHMGWTSLQNVRGRLFDAADEDAYFYFVHSYGCHAANRADCAAEAAYGETFDAALEKGNVFGTQFHPEKSSGTGERILLRFLRLCGEDQLNESSAK